MEKQIKLPSGRIAEIRPFKGKDILSAQKAAGNDQERIIFALIAQTVLIDNSHVVMEDLEEMDGMDVLALMGEFGQNFTSAPSN